MLNTSFGFLLYLLLRNDNSWGLLSDEEKTKVFEANCNHNTTRDDYANPEMYGCGRNEGGENWDSFCLHDNDCRGQNLKDILERKKPASVLEIGPGAGFYTRLICVHKSVKHYTAIDIGGAFLEYLRPRLENVKQNKSFSYELVQGEAVGTDLADKYDFIVLLSAVHHIPNRLELFEKLNSLLLNDGVIYCFDPSHYIPRIKNVIKKCLFDGYLRKSFYSNNYGTHHMCSLGEYKKILRAIPELSIEKIIFQLPYSVRRFEWLFISNKWFSNEIGIILSKKYSGK